MPFGNGIIASFSTLQRSITDLRGVEKTGIKGVLRRSSHSIGMDFSVNLMISFIIRTDW